VRLGSQLDPIQSQVPPRVTAPLPEFSRGRPSEAQAGILPRTAADISVIWVHIRRRASDGTTLCSAELSRPREIGARVTEGRLKFERPNGVRAQYRNVIARKGRRDDADHRSPDGRLTTMPARVTARAGIRQ
jgi:hypothetical protein